MERGYEERQLADRFSTYCDAIAAVSLVNALAFFIAIAEQEVRCSLVDHRLLVVLGGAAIQMAYMAALVTFRRAEVSLREASGTAVPALVGVFKRRLHIARIVLVALVTVLFVFLAWHGLAGTCDG